MRGAAGLKAAALTAAAAALLIIVAMHPPTAYADDISVITWGMPPSVTFVKAVTLSPHDTLTAGNYFRVVYEIKVCKWWYEPESVVKQRVLEHLQKILGQIKVKHPEIWIFYAKYTLVKTAGYMGFAGHYMGTYYYYRAIIIGKVMYKRVNEAGKTKLIAPVIAAIIIAAIIAAAIWGMVQLVHNPAVQKLIAAVSHGINNVAKSTYAFPIATVAAGIGMLLIAIAVALHVFRRDVEDA